MVTGQWVALGTEHRTGEVHADGNHTGLREPGTRPPRDMQAEAAPQTPGARPTARTKHRVRSSPRAAGRSLDTALHESEALWAGSGHRADAHVDTRTDTNTDTQVHWVPTQDRPALGGQAPLGDGTGDPCPPEGRSAAAGEPGRGQGVQKDMPAICRFESRCSRGV